MKTNPRFFHVATETQILTLANDLLFARMELSTLRLVDHADRDTAVRINRCIDHAMSVISEFHSVENVNKGHRTKNRS